MASQGNQLEAHKNVLSKLAKSSDWSSNDNFPLYEYQGFWYTRPFLEGVLRAQELDSRELSLSPSTVILCSSPKCGTTWLKALAFSIANRTKFDPHSENHPLLSSFPHDLVPYIETHNLKAIPDLSLLSTHISYTSLPEWVLEFRCKIVYICRNPKDMFVSLWHFRNKTTPYQKDIPLEKAFGLFCKGFSPFGSYWDHVLGYWKVSLDHPDRVLFLKYEDMMEDTGLHLRRLAEFMGYPFLEEEEIKGVTTKIVEICSFGSLSKLEVNKTGKNHMFKGVDSPAVSNSIFFRKAKVGDWRNYLTQEMADQLDHTSFEKLAKFGLIL